MKLSLRIIYIVVIAVILCALCAGPYAQSSTLLFEENFTSDNSVSGQVAPTQAQLRARGWVNGVVNLGTGYKSEVDPTLKKNVIYAHWSTASAAGGDSQMPDGGAVSLRRFFTPSSDATMYAVVKFHNVAGTPQGAHWISFYNNSTMGEFSPGNIAGEMMLDVSGRDKSSWCYDPTTKQALGGNPQQARGFFLYAQSPPGAYCSTGKSNLYADDVWYEVVWYLKPSTTGTIATAATGNGQMKVSVRALGTPTWVSAFDGANFVNSQRRDPINLWGTSPYQQRWTNDIRHYYSRVVVWSGDAMSNGTLAAFLNTNTPAPIPTPPTPPVPTPTPPTPTPQPPAGMRCGTWGDWSEWLKLDALTEKRTRTRPIVQSGGTACTYTTEVAYRIK